MTKPFEYIASLGFDVYMRNLDSTYCVFTDGTRLGYAQYNKSTGWVLTSVHKPNVRTGTGYSISMRGNVPCKADLEKALSTHCPFPGDNPADVKKYMDIWEYRDSNYFYEDYRPLADLMSGTEEN